MKYKIFAFLLFLGMLSCGNDNNVQNNNPYLPNYPFEITLNLNLPQYNQLSFLSSGIYLDAAGVGIRGVFVFNAGSGNFVAYDAACPNQALSDCSTMILTGISAKCPCDDASYSLFTGLSAGKQYPMKPYRVQVIDATTIKIFN